MNNKGFTIFEISVVIAIIGVLSIVSLPLLASYQKSSKLDNEARALATNLRLTQQLAITEQNIYTLELTTSTDSYRIINSTTDTVKKTVNLDPEVNIDSITNLTDDKVVYNPTGGISEAGFVYLTNSKNETSIIEIKASGYVKISE